MEWESLRRPQVARKMANALAVVVCIAILSLWLEVKAEWGRSQIFASLCSFLIVGVAVIVRFASRRRTRGETDELWITALWTWLVGGIARGIQKFAQHSYDRDKSKEPLLITSRSSADDAR
jgi:threonine/homoserine/homoserine lactone efflux protein